MKRCWIVFFPLLAALNLTAAEQEAEREVYHILQKGFITVAGKTNFFDFNGQALRHEGQLVEEHDRYTGLIRLRFSELQFSLPGVQAVLEEESYINAKKYPEITIDLHQFHPAEQPTRIKSRLRLRGVEKEVELQTKFDYLSPVVKVEGSFRFRQTDFGIKPYSKGMMDIDDFLEVKFKVFFCEVHRGDGAYHAKDQEQMRKLMDEENILILNQKGFFGCSELSQEKP